MKVKTYRSKSLQDALDNIKRDLGHDALILSTRAVPPTRGLGFLSREKWEVTAGISDTPAPQPAAAAAAAAGAGAARMSSTAAVGSYHPTTASTASPSGISETGPVLPFRKAATASTVELAPSPAGLFVPRPDRRIDELLEEMDELKRSVRILGKTTPSKAQDSGSSLYGELVSQGIDADLADRLVGSASRGNPSSDEARERVRRLIADMLAIEPPVELQARGRVVSVFVGPTGVGKTTTIAKIAGHASARLKKKVALISTDMFRVGGQEQLSRFGALLGVPSYICSDISTLKDLINSLDDRDLVLVDTPGASPSDLARLTKLETLLTESGARVNLTISATTRSEDVAKIIKRFQRFMPKRVVVTKIDETDVKSAIVGDLLRNELAISYLTNGQRVPEDLLIPSAMDLACYVLPLETVTVQ